MGVIIFELRNKYHPFTFGKTRYNSFIEDEYEKNENNKTINWLCNLSDKYFYSMINEFLNDSKYSELFNRKEIVYKLRKMKLEKLNKLK
jgi:hypothetical protein